MTVTPAAHFQPFQALTEHGIGDRNSDHAFADLLTSLDNADWELVSEAAAIKPEIGSQLRSFGGGTLLALTAFSQLPPTPENQKDSTLPNVRYVIESIEPWIQGMVETAHEDAPPMGQGSERTLLGAILGNRNGTSLHLRPTASDARAGPQIVQQAPKSLPPQASAGTPAPTKTDSGPEITPLVRSEARQAQINSASNASPFSALLLKEREKLRLVIRVPEFEAGEGTHLHQLVLTMFAERGLPAPEITIHTPKGNDARGGR